VVSRMMDYQPELDHMAQLPAAAAYVCSAGGVAYHKGLHSNNTLLACSLGGINHCRFNLKAAVVGLANTLHSATAPARVHLSA
jgi:hypothetical protein